jgi:hypothetical protein
LLGGRGEADVQKSGADDFEQALETSRRLLASLPGGDAEGTPEGGAPEGGASEGGASEGRASEGRASEGRASEGRASEGRASEGGAPEGYGEAADGLIRAVASGGRIDRVELAPRVLRMDSQTLAEEITRAVNAALADLRTSTAEARGVDLAALQQQVRQAQDEGVRRMALFTSAIQDAMARINRDRP